MSSPQPPRHARTKLVDILSGIACALGLAVLSVLAGSALCFYAGLVVPGFDVRWILDCLAWTMIGVFVLVLGVAALRRRLRWLFSREAARFYRWATLLLLSLVVLFYSIEKWRGKRMWASVTRELAQQGEKPGLSFLVPSPVPDEQNLAKAPIFAPLLEYESKPEGTEIWRDKAGYERLAAITVPVRISQGFHDPEDPPWLRQEGFDLDRAIGRWRNGRPRIPADFQTNAAPAVALLDYLRRFNRDLEEIRAASRRSHARFRGAREASFFEQEPHRRILRDLSNLAAVRAVAEVRTGQAGEALEDAQLGLRLTRAAYEDPALYSYGLCSAMTIGVLQPVWEGLAAERWSEAQLVALQNELASLEPLNQHRRWIQTFAWTYADLINQIFPATAPSAWPAFMGPDEKASRVLLSFLRAIYPTGWSYQNQAGLYRQYLETLEAVDVAGERVYPKQLEAVKRFPSLDPFHAIYMTPKFVQFDHEATCAIMLAQTALNQARVACALERYRLAQGQYPAQLAALTPRFMEKVPSDLFSDLGLRYRSIPGGRFWLYSVGWNETDENGVVKTSGNEQHPRIDMHSGDWVWTYVSPSDR